MYLEKWFEMAKNIKKLMLSEGCGFYCDKGPYIQFTYFKWDDGVNFKWDDGINYVDADAPMENEKFSLPETIRTQFVATYTSFANTHDLKFATPGGVHSYPACEFYDIIDMDILAKIVRVYMNILGTEYGEIKFKQW